VKRLALALVFVASIARAQGWGWTPITAPIPIPPSTIAVRIGTALQPIVDALPAAGGVIQLDPGRFYADASDSTIALTLSKPVTIIGTTYDATTMASPILISSPDCHLERFRVQPSGAAYGIKIFQSGAGVARSSLRDMFVGAVDTTARNAGQGPVIGLYLDGAILTTIDHCTFAFCTQSGVYLNSSGLPNWSTNENIFTNCTSNLSSHYGVEIIGGGIQGFQWLGGNMEDNTWGAVFVQSATNLTFRGVDFESTVFPIADLLSIATSAPSTIEDCNFNTSGVTRAFNFFTCAQVSVLRNRLTTFSAYSNAGTFDDRSSNCIEWGNVFNTGGYIENRTQPGIPSLAGLFQPNLRSYYGVLWGPSAAGTAATIGSAWTATGAVTNPAPTTSHLSGWLRRTVFTGAAAAETGIKQTGASDFQFWSGDSAGTGGFYFSATFRLDAWPANTGRLFVGLVASGSVAPASVADSTGLTGDAIGLYHDANDVVNVFRIVAVKAGVATKFALTNGATAPVLDNSQGFRFEMIAWPNANAVYCRLYSLNKYGTLAGLVTLTNAITKTALMAPQVEVGSAAGTYSIGVANVTCQVAR